MKVLIILPLLISLGCSLDNGDPYTSGKTYGPDWEIRSFKCDKFSGVPEFTLAPYSDPTKRELGLLCDCLGRMSKQTAKMNDSVRLGKKNPLWWFGGAVGQCLKE